MNLTFNGERTIFVHHQKRPHPFDLDRLTTPWIYVTSMGESWKHVYQGIIAHAKQHPELKIAFNPGTKQLGQGKDIICELLPFAHVFIANKEEYISLIHGEHAKSDAYTPRDLLHSLRKMGGKLLLLTDGDHGSYVLDEEGKEYHGTIIPTETIGKTGAGDAFSTGFIASLMKNGSISDALRLGTANAASVVSSIGAQTGLLHKNDLHLWHEKMQHVIVHES
jgi:ribokinase